MSTRATKSAFRAARRRPVSRAFQRWIRATGRAFRAVPMPLRIAATLLALVVIWSGLNLVYQVIRKPTLMFFPVSQALAKTPDETWRDYAPLFRRFSTPVVTPELLAALAQMEGAGNPVAQTYWRWRFAWNPFEIYRPASSAVGMYQMTDPAFAEARRYCIRNHAVVAAGSWRCWFNGLYTRVLPAHAVELTAVYLDRGVDALSERRGSLPATLRQKQELAAVIHLCGAGPAAAYARRGFRAAPGERCGDHDLARYLAGVQAMKRRFVRLGTED